MAKKKFMGFEPWVVGDTVVTSYITGDFVRVLDAKAGYGDEYTFTVLINKERLGTTENSGLKLMNISVTVSDIHSDDDLRRVIQKFEILANTFNNETKARKPNYIRKFESLNLSCHNWKMFP